MEQEFNAGNKIKLCITSMAKGHFIHIRIDAQILKKTNKVITAIIL